MKIEGLLTEKGIGAQDIHAHISGMPRVWVIVLQECEIEIWGRGNKGFEVIAKALSVSDGDKLADNLSEWLLTALDQDVLDRIILVGAPQVLRVFHDTFSTDIIACIAAEIPRDFSGLSLDARKENIERMVFI
jgi:hypothetical protein